MVVDADRSRRTTRRHDGQVVVVAAAEHPLVGGDERVAPRTQAPARRERERRRCVPGDAKRHRTAAVEIEELVFGRCVDGRRAHEERPRVGRMDA